MKQYTKIVKMLQNVELSIARQSVPQILRVGANFLFRYTGIVKAHQEKFGYPN